MHSSDLPRTVLPIPERPHTGLVTYDAKDPDTTLSRRSRRFGHRPAPRTW